MNKCVVFAVLRWYKSRSMSKALDVQYAALCNVTIDAHYVWCCVVLTLCTHIMYLVIYPVTMVSVGYHCGLSGIYHGLN